MRTTVPVHEDEWFVLNFHIDATSSLPHEQDLKIILSTPRLLRQVSQSEMVHIDATYKFNWQGYPPMVIDTRDADHIFHPYAAAVCNNERSDGFEFIFRFQFSMATIYSLGRHSRGNNCIRFKRSERPSNYSRKSGTKRERDRRVKEFVTYFEEQWFDKNQNWYEGAALGQPSTNSGIESTNAAIKRGHTLRERLPVGQVLNA